MNSADLVWILVSSALVLFMTPGLALFYGGMVRSKNTLNMLMMNLWCLLVVPLVWVAVGYSLSFSGTNGFIGDFSTAGFAGLSAFDDSAAEFAAAMFLATFAAITPALIAGAVADRMKFAAWAIFVPVWSLLVYAPVTHWVFATDGWLRARGSLDFAGGTSIHVNAGTAALVAALMLGSRRGWPGSGFLPHSMPLVVIGTGILWLGWFGFNAGSALAANGHAAHAFLTTLLASCAGGLVWSLVERFRDGHFTTLGVVSGVVAGLVAITPGCAFVSPISAVAIGAAAGALCSYAVSLKSKLGYDDSLDVVGIHLVGGLVGSVLIGVFADAAASGWGADDIEDGLLAGGGAGLLFEQIFANAITMIYSAAVTAAILFAIKALIGLRVDPEQEVEGLDASEHAESAYHQGGFSAGRA